MQPAILDGVDLRALAARVGTPFHAYSANAIRARIAELQAALGGMDALACYAVKANPNRAVLDLMANAGLGADIVSAGEMRRALIAGIPPERIVFSGVGKAASEVAEALDAGVGRFNVESREELRLLQECADSRGSSPMRPSASIPTWMPARTPRSRRARRRTSSASACRRRADGSPRRVRFRQSGSTGCTCTSAPRSCRSSPSGWRCSACRRSGASC